MYVYSPYVYVYIYIYIYIHICIYVYIYIYIYTYIYIFIYIFIYIYIYTCIYIQKIEWGKSCRIQGMPIYVHVHIFINIFTYTYVCIQMQICTENAIWQTSPNPRNAYTCICTYICIYAYMYRKWHWAKVAESEAYLTLVLLKPQVCVAGFFAGCDFLCMLLRLHLTLVFCSSSRALQCVLQRVCNRMLQRALQRVCSARCSACCSA